jgi:hypothetical protein
LARIISEGGGPRYQFDTKRNVIEALDEGPHENFYRELQKYLDAR